VTPPPPRVASARPPPAAAIDRAPQAALPVVVPQRKRGALPIVLGAALLVLVLVTAIAVAHLR
jgi:hypothetical protein